MKKAKILRIITRLNIGGPAIHTILLTEGLDKNKFDSMLVCGKPGKNEGNMHYYAAEKNVKPVYITQLHRELNLLKDIVALFKIFKIIIGRRPNIIHTHTAKAGAIGRICGIIYNLCNPCHQINLIHTFHGHIFEGYFYRIKVRIFILLERFLAIFSSRILTVSPSLKKELVSLKIAKAEKIEVIPLGFELGKFLDIPFREDREIFNVGIVGRLTPIKNHYLFLESAAKILNKKNNFNIKFKIIGDGELKQELMKLVFRLNIQASVDFLGWQKDLAFIYSNLDLVALTSINEGTPVSLIEAMASGRVVVSTDVGGVKDLLGEESPLRSNCFEGFKIAQRGLLVKSQDSEGFSGALAYILSDKDLRRVICQQARNFARDNFCKERLIKDIENLYIQPAHQNP